MGKMTQIVSSIVVMVVTTFLYLMAQITESPVPTAISIIYGISMGFEIILAGKNAIELDIDIELNKQNKEDK